MEMTWGPGRVIAGRYRLVSQLGQGGMGAVWRADHMALSSPVAIKLIDPEIARRPEMLERFQREAQSSAALRSPHVVQIFDYGVDEGVPYIAMELLEGESLADRLKRLGTLPYGDTVRIVSHVGRALAKAHEAGVIHRDLKPDNVFLVKNDDKEIAKVLDFGIAKILGNGPGSIKGNSTRTGSILGTPSYMSPEQAQGTKTIDGRSDLWSLAVIAFECVCGQVPFVSEALGDLLIKICVHPIPMPSSIALVPPGFDAWWAQASSRDPALRFQTGKDLTDALRQALTPEAGGYPTSGPRSPSAAALGASNTVGATPLHVSAFTPAGQQHTPAPGGQYAQAPGGQYAQAPGGYTPAPGGQYTPAPGGYTPVPGQGPTMPSAGSQPPDQRYSPQPDPRYSQPSGSHPGQSGGPHFSTSAGASVSVEPSPPASRMPIYALGALLAAILSGVGVWLVLGHGPAPERSHTATPNGAGSLTPLTVLPTPTEPVVAPAATPIVSAAPVTTTTPKPAITTRPSGATKPHATTVVATPPPTPTPPTPRSDRIGF